jgi:TonB family protein
MKVFSCLIILSLTFCGAQSAISGAQNTTGNKREIKVTKLSSPVYPPLARQARVNGDVRLELKIRPDGGVAEAAVLSGHPMLQQAAVDSAQKSQFSCSGCSDLTSYPMTYRFDFLEGTGCQETTVASRFRSPKCVYLWKCGSRLTTESVIVSRPQEVTESDGHVTVLASAACVQPMRSYEGKTR